MQLINRSLSLLVLLLTLSTLALCGVIRDGSLSANSNGNDITIRWQSEDETGALQYAIERKAGVNGQFDWLSDVPMRGNNLTYAYVDDSAFRTTESVYQYRIKVSFSNGTTAYYGPITVSHSVSSVRRTWGSIKAMFR